MRLRLHVPFRPLLAGLALAAALVTTGPAASAASPSTTTVGDTPSVQASLLAEQARIAPGQPFTVALRQQIRDGWHTYWVNPGDSGTPTEIAWKLPPGFTAGPIEWPAPAAIPYGPLLNHGYEKDVALLVQITPPKDLAAGSTVVLAADVQMLVCADICVPEDASVTLALPVATTPQADPANAALFARARESLPAPSPFAARFQVAGNELRLAIDSGDASKLAELRFFPLAADQIQHAAPQRTAGTKAGIAVAVERAPNAPKVDRLDGVLTFRDLATGKDAPVHAIAFSAVPGTVAAVAGGAGAGGDTGAGIGIGEALLFALLGGLILNLMPCVFPVLSIKALSFVRHAEAAPGTVRAQALAYTAGVLASFTIIAGILLALRAGGAEIGWGFQLQSPLVITALIYLLFAVGLSLSGVFTLGGGLVGMGSSLATREGLAGSFFTGALATIVATPCTAPFMAAALGFALVQPPLVSLAVFEALGIGLALPYLLLALRPSWARLLPRPGAWMERFKQFLAFPIYATIVWLAFVLAAQAGATAIAAVGAGLVLIAFAAWAWEAVRLGSNRGRALGGMAAVAALLGALFLVHDVEAAGTPSGNAGAQSALPGGGAVAWQPFSQGRLDALLAEGKPVFVDFTAAWCITCLVNEKVALTADVASAFEQRGITALRGDWTNRDPEITRILQRHNRAGVPLYLYYPAGAKEPVVLPQILTPDNVRAAISS